ncbi:MAG: AraC family transcriptional regulator [Eubacteriaceae bacterium]|nr:AraC family transcriptional regulator [Eubacteriaceae bacterium]
MDYIEDNISDNLTIKELSEKFYLSEFHFSRIFRIAIGISVKQYVLGRKLSLSLYELIKSDKSVTDIAFKYGFIYPEVFSRAFKKHFGISPSDIRNNKTLLFNKDAFTDKAEIVERDIANYQGMMTIKETFIYLDETALCGMSVIVDESRSSFNDDLTAAGEKFIKNTNEDNFLKQDKFYVLVSCFGDDSGKYTVYYGKEILVEQNKLQYEKRRIPKGWYASFSYSGNLTDNRLTFVDDFYRWLMIKEVQLEDNGIGMLNIFNPENLQDVKILIPVKNPK